MTYRNSRRQEVLDAFRDHLERMGQAPSSRVLGKATGMSAVGAWKHVQALIAEGTILKMTARRGRPPSKLALPDLIDLSPIPTERLRRELARRGITMDALAEPKVLLDEGRACAANLCQNRVKRGRLMCREHWFQLPPGYRSDIIKAWSARQPQAFQEALERARNYLGGYSRVVERVG